MGMKADQNDDMSIDGDECDNLEDEFEGFVCHAILDNCDLDGDGAVHGCEFLACVHMHGEETGCIAECPCKPDDESMYCWGLGMCIAMMEEEMV